MGAAASVHSIYSESSKWFKEYFDTDLYRKDFENIDKDNDGGISYSELHRWIKAKVETEGGSWKIFLSNPEVIQFAHVQSCTLYNRHKTVVKKKVIGIDDFRTFLVHFYAISILWVHFKNADEFVQANDFGNLKLTFEEFKLAVRTLTATQAQEECSESQLMEDFKRLDIDKSNSLGFVEVCAHCCKYIDPNFDPHNLTPSAHDYALPPTLEELQLQENHEKHRLLALQNAFEPAEISESVLAELGEVSEIKRSGQFQSVKARNQMAVDAIQDEVEKAKAAAKFEEVKFTTESEMDALLKNI